MKKINIFFILMALLLALFGCPQESSDDNDSNKTNALSDEAASKVASGLADTVTTTATIEGSDYEVKLNADTGIFTAAESSDADFSYAGEFFYYSDTLQFRITAKNGINLNGADMYMSVENIKLEQLSADNSITFIATTKAAYDTAKEDFHASNPLVIPSALAGNWEFDLSKLDKSVYDEQTLAMLEQLNPSMIYTFGSDGSISGSMTYSGLEQPIKYDAFAYIITCSSNFMVYDVNITQVLGSYMANADMTLIMPRIKAEYKISGSQLRMDIDNGVKKATNYFNLVGSATTTTTITTTTTVTATTTTTIPTDTALNALVGTWQVIGQSGQSMPVSETQYQYLIVEQTGLCYFGSYENAGLWYYDNLMSKISDVTDTKFSWSYLASYDQTTDTIIYQSPQDIYYTISNDTMIWEMVYETGHDTIQRLEWYKCKKISDNEVKTELESPYDMPQVYIGKWLAIKLGDKDMADESYKMYFDIKSDGQIRWLEISPINRHNIMKMIVCDITDTRIKTAIPYYDQTDDVFKTGDTFGEFIYALNGDEFSLFSDNTADPSSPIPLWTFKKE